MSLPITLIKSEKEFEDLSFENISWLGEGNFGVVLQAKYKNETYAIKILETSISDKDEKKGFPKGSDVLKEAVIGFELVQRLPVGIKEYFTGVYELLVCRGFVCPDVVTNLVKNQDLKDNLSASNEFYIIVQEFKQGVKSAAEWVSKQGEIKEEIIRSIMFQFVLSLCYAQSILGFQHNDLKLQNIMFIENNTGKDIPKQIRFASEGDDFEYVIPAGGVQVRIIDLGSATLCGSSKEHKYVQQASQFTPGYLPFESSLIYDSTLAATTRLNDADLQAIFKILINICMHNRVKKPDGSLWKLVHTDVDTKDYTEYDWSTKEENLLTKSLGNTLLSKFSLDQLKSIIVDMFLLKSLQIPILFPASFDGSTIDKEQEEDIKKVFRLITDNAFLSTYSGVNDYFKGTLDVVKGIFSNYAGLDFLKKLGSPFFDGRLSFGLPTPYQTHCLANAVYHPFFAFYYWKKGLVGATVVAEPLEKPLIFLDTKNNKENQKKKQMPKKITDSYLEQLEAIRAIDVSETPAPSVVVTTKTKGKKKKKKDTPPARKSYLPWTLKKLQEDEVDINWVENIATEEELLGIPDDLINQLSDADFVVAWARKLGSTTGAKSISGARQALKKIIQARKTGLAESAIYEQLESIEHNVDFISENDTFDTQAIEENLYLPLRDMVAENPQLAPVAVHLGIDKPLFDHATVDMTKRSNQIRFLHTLSILAEMAESKNVTDEKIERCFVEWPPQPRYKMGEVNEI